MISQIFQKVRVSPYSGYLLVTRYGPEVLPEVQWIQLMSLFRILCFHPVHPMATSRAYKYDFVYDFKLFWWQFQVLNKTSIFILIKIDIWQEILVIKPHENHQSCKLKKLFILSPVNWGPSTYKVKKKQRKIFLNKKNGIITTSEIFCLKL